MENAILDIQNVSVRFANGSAVQAVEQVSLSVFPSDKLCIIGETGSGKSILLLSVLRLLPASAVVSGDVCFHGQSLFALSPKQMDGVRGGQISYVPQGSGNGMNPLISVGFQVGEPLIAHRGMNKKRAIARAVELMRRFHLGREEELARQYPYTLSGGMRQRALIAMGISADAELLLFDEPTKGLDEARIRLVADTLNELDGQTMVCVTHDLSFARDVANRIGVMYAANLIEVADADELYAHPLHPYTRDLLAAMPENGLHFRPGYAPAHDDTRVTGCKYRMRCPNCSEKCAYRDRSITELIRPAVVVPDWARQDAGLAGDAKLDCYVDEDTHELTVVEADYAHDLSDVPPELLFALHQSGCCLSALEDALMEDDVIYDK